MKSVGIVVISHGRIGAHMVRAVHSIVTNPIPLVTVSFFSWDSSEKCQEKLKRAIGKADQGAGVLLLADLMGATPANLCRPLLRKRKVAMVSGYNLPMLIKLSHLHKKFKTPEELADFIKSYGRKNITIAAKNSKN